MKKKVMYAIAILLGFVAYSLVEYAFPGILSSVVTDGFLPLQGLIRPLPMDMLSTFILLLLLTLGINAKWNLYHFSPFMLLVGVVLLGIDLFRPKVISSGFVYDENLVSHYVEEIGLITPLTEWGIIILMLGFLIHMMGEPKTA